MAIEKAEVDEIVDFTDAPSDKETKELRELCVSFVKTDREIAELEIKLSDAKTRKQELERKTLPDLMMKIKQDKVGLAEADVDIVLSDFYHANIATDWEPERREAAFAYLEQRGDGDLIKTTVTIALPRRMLDAARWIVAALTTLFHYHQAANVPGTPSELPAPDVNMGVHFATLTSFVKEQVEAGREIDLDVLGATVGKIVKIKPRNKKLKKGK